MPLKMRKSLLNLIYAQMIGFFVAKECNFSNCSPFHANGCVFPASGVLVLISCLIYCQCSEYPQRGYQKHNILVTGILNTRGYPKRCDTFRLSETWSFLFVSDNFSEVYGQASHFCHGFQEVNKKIVVQINNKQQQHLFKHDKKFSKS